MVAFGFAHGLVGARVSELRASHGFVPSFLNADPEGQVGELLLGDRY
jgi:hypothetical protein